MKLFKTSPLPLTAAAVLALSLLSANADAQWWRTSSPHGSSCASQRTDLRSDVFALDRQANQLVQQFSREMACGCRDSLALLNHMKRNATLTRNLTVALNGTCKCTFKKAACAVNDSMNGVSKASRRVNLSCYLKGSIADSLVLAKRIHRNADRFTPRGTYTSIPRPAKPHHNQDPYASLLSNLLRASFNR